MTAPVGPERHDAGVVPHFRTEAKAEVRGGRSDPFLGDRLDLGTGGVQVSRRAARQLHITIGHGAAGRSRAPGERALVPGPSHLAPLHRDRAVVRLGRARLAVKP